ncbi:MAG TPA: flagellar biosynthetic protein FliR [Sphingobium sp.]|nr:flagellar biosynthetic protein FliR [Sphingobium sp.]
MDALPIDAAAFLILFARVGAVLMLLPAFSEEAAPMRVRLAMALGFSVGLYGLLSPKVAPAAHADGALPMIVVAEMLVGMALGMIVRMLFSAAAMAGSIVNLQIGLASALVADPSMGGQSPLLARLLGLAALIVCMSVGVHHLWIASIVNSYQVFPVGGLPPAQDFAMLAVRVLGQATSLGVSLAAPLILFGAIFNLGLGLAARVAPTIQVFFITQPLNLLLGLSVLAMVAGTMLNAFAEAMGRFMQNGWSF